VILSPEEYASAPASELLRAAARGQAGLDRRWVRALVDRGDAVLGDFVRFLREEHEDDRVELGEELLEIARALRTPAALELYTEYARQVKYVLPDELTEAYAELGGEAIEALLELDQESHGAPDVRFALAVLGARDPRILRLLTGYLEEDPADAALALGIYGDPAARLALTAALVRASDEATRRLLAGAIEELETVRARPEIEPFDIWELYPEEAPPRFAVLDDEELREFLKSPAPPYRASAIEMLAFETPAAETATRILELAQRDPEVEVRATAWEALEGVEDPAGIQEVLRRMARDEGAPVEERAAALVAIAADARRDEGVRERILEYFENPETRAQAVKAMWHSGDRRFEVQVAKALDDRDKDVVRQAVTAVGLFGMVAQVGRLERLFEDEDLRAPALYGYALAAPTEVTPARLKKLFRMIEELAGELSDEHAALVAKAFDDRLAMNGLDPVFLVEDAEQEDAEPSPAPAAGAKVGRNDPCPCGSGKKHKKCCGA
jgi:HEAT repeat protein